MEITDDKLRKRYAVLLPHLSEKQKRLLVASDAVLFGRGGSVLVSKASGVSRSTIRIGTQELSGVFVSEAVCDGRIRRKGGGRKSLIDSDLTLDSDLEQLISPETRGDPESPLRWCSKSLRKIAVSLQQMGHRISHNAVGDILAQKGYSLQANKKVDEGSKHQDRDAQFHFINDRVQQQLTLKEPVISVDCKKKELIGNFKNNGREWEKKKNPIKVNTYDFQDKELGKAAPYGVYDIEENEAFVNVGISSDTAEFAVQSIRMWWLKMGQLSYPEATELMITADGGGSNSSRSRLWKAELQKFSNETRLKLLVSHFPPGTSKWNKIEHRLFSFVSMNWRGKPLTSLQVIVQLIGNTTSKEGLFIKTAIDKNIYLKGRTVTNEDFKNINLIKETFHGEWNYTIAPS